MCVGISSIQLWKPGTPTMGEGVHIQENSSLRPRSKYTHSGHNTQRSFDPHPPPTTPHPKRGTQVLGGGGMGTGVKIQKIIGGSFLVLK